MRQNMLILNGFAFGLTICTCLLAFPLLIATMWAWLVVEVVSYFLPSPEEPTVDTGPLVSYQIYREGASEGFQQSEQQQKPTQSNGPADPTLNDWEALADSW